MKNRRLAGNQNEENESDSDDSAEEPVALSYAERYRQPLMQDSSSSKEPTGSTSVSQAVADLQRVGFDTRTDSERERLCVNVDDAGSHCAAPSSIGNESEAVGECDLLAATEYRVSCVLINSFL